MSVRKAKYGTPVVLAMILASWASTQPVANSLLGFGASANAAESNSSALAAVGLAPSNTLDSSIRQAQTLRQDGDLQGAATILGQLVLAAPDDPRVLGEYGKTLAAEGHPDDALAFLRRAMQLQQNDWTLYSAIGVCYDQKGNYTAAKTAYDRALALQPGEPSVLSNAALSRMLAGDLDSAEQLLMQASTTGKDNEKITKNLALVRSLKGSSGPQVAQHAPRSAPVAQVAAAPQPAPAPVAAAKSAPTPIVASAKPAAKTYEALKHDPSVRMAPIPQEEVAAKPAPASHVAAAAPATHVAAQTPAAKPVTKTAAQVEPQPQLAPHVLTPAPVAKVADTAPAATAAPKPIVQEGALKVEKTAAKETPKPAKAVAKIEAKPAATPAPVKAAVNAPAAPAVKPAATPVLTPATKTAAATPAKAKPAEKTAALEDAMLRPTVTDVTPVAATAHKNATPNH